MKARSIFRAFDFYCQVSFSPPLHAENAPMKKHAHNAVNKIFIFRMEIPPNFVIFISITLFQSVVNTRL
jgi:hypothetical protein